MLSPTIPPSTSLTFTERGTARMINARELEILEGKARKVVRRRQRENFWVLAVVAVLGLLSLVAGTVIRGVAGHCLG